MKIFKVIFNDIKYVLNYKYFASIFFLAHISLKRDYRESFLGIIWTLIQPAMQITVLALVFSHIMRFPVENYALYLMTGILPWTLIVSSFSNGSGALIKRSVLLKGGCTLPKTMFVFSDVFTNIYVYLISFITMYLIVGLFFADLSWQFLWWPLVSLPLIFTCFFASVGFAYMAPYMKDIGHIITVLLNAIFWTVPIVYPVSIIPEDKLIFFEMNPFYILIRPIQQLVHGGTVPGMVEMGLAFGVAFLAAVFAWATHKLLKRRVVYYL